MRHQVASDLQALLHAAGKRHRRVVQPARVNLHFLQPVPRHFTQVAVVPVADRHQTFRDVRASADLHAQAVAGVLTNEAPIGARQQAQPRALQRGQIDEALVTRVVPDAAGIRLGLVRHGRQQGAFARAGLADHAQHFAGIQVEADVAAAMHAVPRARHVAHGKQRLGSHAAASLSRCCVWRW
ncbi:hypothetical protein G6F22_017632 [Rhizopus arrhizus]|nr:hypothetical protein G6F22_017632 [Rhizopus arrhizus]